MTFILGKYFLFLTVYRKVDENVSILLIQGIFAKSTRS